jgi:hypothetical protein
MEIGMIKIRRNKAAWLILLMALSFAFSPVVAMAQVAWIKGFDAALQQAAREKKFVILDISASW